MAADALVRLRADSYTDLERQAGMAATDEGVVIQTQRAIRDIFNGMGPMYERCKAGLTPMISEIADGDKCQE